MISKFKIPTSQQFEFRFRKIETMLLPAILLLNLIIGLHIIKTITDHLLVNKIKNLPPAPFPPLPIVGHLHLFKIPLFRNLSKLSARYGPVILLKLGSRRVLIVSSPSAAEECFTRNDIVFANRPHLLSGKHLGYNYTSLVWSSYGDHWRTLTRISSVKMISTNRLQTLSSIRKDEVSSLLLRVYSNYQDGNQAIDLKPALFEFTLNVMMRMIAGKRYNIVADAEEANKYHEIVSQTGRSIGIDVLDFFPVLRWIGFGGTEKRLEELQKKRDRFMQEL